MRTITRSTVLALALIGGAAPAFAQQDRISICVIADGRLTEVTADYSPVTGDTMIAGKLFRVVHPERGSQYAAAATWYVNNEPILVNGTNFVKYGLPRILGVMDVSKVGEFGGVQLFAEYGAAPTPDVLYVPVRPGCEFQPYTPGEAYTGTEDPYWSNIDYSETVRGKLDEWDDLDLSDAFVDTYLFQGKAGETAVIEMLSDDFDAYLMVDVEGAEGLDEVAHNDDGFDSGTDARVVVTLPVDGTYYIFASSVFPEEMGEYTLSLSRGESPTAEPAATATLRTITGSLAAGDPRLSDGTYYDDHRISVRPGQRLVITLASNDFDTYLYVGEEGSLGFSSLKSNDDGDGMGTDSRVELHFDEGGEYVVRANSMFEGETGEYTLTIAESR